MLKLDNGYWLRHRNHKLSNWVDMARNFGDTPREKIIITEKQCQKIITTWGGGVNEIFAVHGAELIGDSTAQKVQCMVGRQKTR